MLAKIWGKGFVTVGEVTYDSASYVSSYCVKKITGLKAEDHYIKLNLNTGELAKVEPEYATMSRRPGIGREWYEEYKNDVFPSDEVPVVGKGVFKSRQDTTKQYSKVRMNPRTQRLRDYEKFLERSMEKNIRRED